jgi:hypothetical protein
LESQEDSTFPLPRNLQALMDALDMGVVIEVGMERAPRVKI